MKTITKEFSFDAAHRLYDPKLSEKENLKIFGKCTNMHGHTYKLFVTVGNHKEENGMIINFVELKKIVNEKIIERFDHKVLNEDPLYRDGRLSTCENQVDDMWELILPHIIADSDVWLEEIKLYETPTSYCTRIEG